MASTTPAPLTGAKSLTADDQAIYARIPVAVQLLYRQNDSCDADRMWDRATRTAHGIQHHISSICGSEYDPRHVEAYMRVGHAVGLQALSGEEFHQECKAAMLYIDLTGPHDAERLASRFGL